MVEQKLSFKKKLISKDRFFTSVVRYELEKDNVIISTLEIKSLFYAEIIIESKKYIIKPIQRFIFFNISHHIIEADTQKIIGKFDRIFGRGKILIFSEKSGVIHKFRFKRYIFLNRKKENIAELENGEQKINYIFKTGNPLINDSDSFYLSEVSGTIFCKGSDILLPLIGLYLLELLIYNNENGF